MDKLKRFLTPAHVTIKDGWEQLSRNGYRALFVVDEKGRLIGSVTDGDVRRWVLQDKPLSAPLENVMNRSPYAVFAGDKKAKIKEVFLKRRIECIPVLDEDSRILDIIFWDDVLKGGETAPTQKRPIDLPVVIMAGGKGKRLEPFTKIIPKPLIPIGDKAAIEIIMDRFAAYGIRDFHLTLNYKAVMIKAYFQEAAHSFNISYVTEDKPQGTAGALSLLKGSLTTPFIVSNADIIIEADYADIVEFHRRSGNHITLVCSMKHFPIPYGVVEIAQGGELRSIQEKPELDYLVLTGLYVIEPEALALIPEDEYFDMPHLIEKIRGEKLKVGVYPISETAWMDIGEMAEYNKTMQRFGVR